MFCREGLIQLEYMQREIMEGKGKMNFGMTDRRNWSCNVLFHIVFCRTDIRKIVLSATEQFEEEYEAHIRKKYVLPGHAPLS